ncbi:glycine oxidase ThiO [Egibacter rhizosphaerae]|uniref:glycine oxidase n=1 Tax=Egibacter rhizosphaerae TaxID=1670831 RepID=A0A411YAD1_9ACTN|nr:glycine oxidase ThiO [Egibacter rhizosphaerae]QBI18161.1 glycine oxidase ThiO [Egibacter rhizosphaerae]
MADAIVVGGGVIGLSSAWRLAQQGAEVVCCDPSHGRGASWAAAGMLAPVTEVTYSEAAHLRLNLASRERWPAFAESLTRVTGNDVGFRECGALKVARDAGDRAELEQLTEFQHQLGLDVTLLRSREARRLEPALAPGVRGAIDCPQDAHVDNRELIEALSQAARDAGATLPPVEVERVRSDGSRVLGVRLADGGSIDAPTVVVTAGAGTAALAGRTEPDEAVAQALPPVRPVKGQLLHLHAEPGEPPIAERLIRGLLVYIVPFPDGHVVVGATAEERGWDRRATAGAVHDLLRDATELLPGLLEHELLETATGLRPATPDNAPALGPSGPDGLIVATGHWRNGLLLAPITSEAVTAWAAGDAPPEEAHGFGVERFEPRTSGEVPAVGADPEGG